MIWRSILHGPLYQHIEEFALWVCGEGLYMRTTDPVARYDLRGEVRWPHAEPSGHFRSDMTNWSVAIFTSREDIATLSATVNAMLIASACAEQVTVDVVVNGNRELADQAVVLANQRHAASGNVRMRIWYVALGDKSHAWNEYVHRIWPESELAFFVDGYAQVFPDAFSLISAAMKAAPHAMAGTGVPSMGFSARAMASRMRREGGIYGNLYAVRGDVMQILRSRGFHLLLGMYRTDSLLNASICFGLDPERFHWDSSRIVVERRASWSFRPLRFWRPADIRSYLKRILRQAQGEIITEAIKQHLAVKRKPPETLPITVAELVQTWLAALPRRAHTLLRLHPLYRIAIRCLQEPRDWSLAAKAPVLMAASALPAEQSVRHVGPGATG